MQNILGYLAAGIMILFTLSCGSPPENTTTVSNSSNTTTSTTVAGPIPLCPGLGYTSTYPQQAICLSGQLYSLYNSGVVTYQNLIPLGVYPAQVYGCAFTVGPNCTITR